MEVKQFFTVYFGALGSIFIGIILFGWINNLVYFFTPSFSESFFYGIFFVPLFGLVASLLYVIFIRRNRGWPIKIISIAWILAITTVIVWLFLIIFLHPVKR